MAVEEQNPVGGVPMAESFFLAHERRFVRATVRRKWLFLGLSLLGVAVAAGLAFYYGYRRWSDPDYALGLRPVVILLILLNARQNLRQHRYARLLDRLCGGNALLRSPHPEPASREPADRTR